MLTTGHFLLVIAAIGCFAASWTILLLRPRIDRPALRRAAKLCICGGVTVAAAALAWHSIQRQSWVPLGNNFDALIWLAVVLALFVVYVQRTRPLAGLDWFIVPIVILLLVGAVITGKTNQHEYVHSLWSLVHLVSSYGGAAAFAVAGASGAMYLIANYQLRRKVALAGPNMGSLERLEHLTLVAVTLGFALLTIGAVTGFLKMRFEQGTAPVAKVVLSAAVWLVYAVVLHSPINPSFRGRRAAMLSIVGFVLMVGTIVLVLLMPGKG